MTALALSLTLRSYGVDFAFVGVAVAVLTVSHALGGPMLSRVIDRRSQTVVLIPSATVSAAALLTVASAPTNTTLVLVGVAVAGAAIPPLGPSLRALWPTLLGRENLPRAYSIDSVGQELVFVTGPLVVAAAVALGSPELALVLTALLCLLGTTIVVTAQPSRRWRGVPRQAGWLGPLRSRRLVLLLTGVAGCAGPVGALNIVAVAYAERRPVWGGAAVLLGVFATGALVGALIHGSRRWSMPPSRRAIAVGGGLTFSYLFVASMAPVPVMVLICFTTGLFLPPLLVIAFGLVDELAPDGTVVEAFAWLVTLFAAGSSAGVAIAGAVLDHAGASAATVATAALGLLGTAILAYFHRLYSRGEARGRRTKRTAGSL